MIAENDMTIRGVFLASLINFIVIGVNNRALIADGSNHFKETVL